MTTLLALAHARLSPRPGGALVRCSLPLCASETPSRRRNRPTARDCRQMSRRWGTSFAPRRSEDFTFATTYLCRRRRSPLRLCNPLPARRPTDARNRRALSPTERPACCHRTPRCARPEWWHRRVRSSRPRCWWEHVYLGKPQRLFSMRATRTASLARRASKRCAVHPVRPHLGGQHRDKQPNRLLRPSWTRADGNGPDAAHPGGGHDTDPGTYLVLHRQWHCGSQSPGNRRSASERWHAAIGLQRRIAQTAGSARFDIPVRPVNATDDTSGLRMTLTAPDQNTCHVTPLISGLQFRHGGRGTVRETEGP